MKWKIGRQFFWANNSFSSEILYFSSRYDTQSDELIAFFHFFCFFGEMFRARKCACKRVLYLFWPPPASPTQLSFLIWIWIWIIPSTFFRKVAHTSLWLGIFSDSSFLCCTSAFLPYNWRDTNSSDSTWIVVSCSTNTCMNGQQAITYLQASSTNRHLFQ